MSGASEPEKEAIRRFLRKHIGDAELSDQDDIFARGLVTSLFAMQLVRFLEKTFAIALHDDDLVVERFRSVDAMASLVASRRETP